MTCPTHRALRPISSLARALPTGIFIFSQLLGNSAVVVCQAWCGSEPEPVPHQLPAAWLQCPGFGAGHTARVRASGSSLHGLIRVHHGRKGT